MRPETRLAGRLLGDRRNSGSQSAGARARQGKACPGQGGGETDVVWGCFHLVVQWPCLPQALLTLSKLRVHDGCGGALEKGVILVRKANGTRESREGAGTRGRPCQFQP